MDRDQAAREWRLMLAVFVFASLAGPLNDFWTGKIGELAAALSPASESTGFGNRDFVNYWMGGIRALSGDLAPLFIQPQHQAALDAQFGAEMEIRAWSYPPHLLLFLWPLGALPYGVAYAAFQGAGLAVFALAIRDLARQWHRGTVKRQMVALLLLPFAVAQIVMGQNGFFYAALMLFALTRRGTSPILCGLALAILTTKPQLGLLFPFLLLIERDVRSIVWTVVFTAGLLVLSLLFFGFESWRVFFEQAVPFQLSIMRDWYGDFLGLMPGVFGTARRLGFDYETALASQRIASLVVLFAASWLMLRARVPEQRSRILLGGTFLVTPYAFTYDLGALLAMLAVLLAHDHTDSTIAAERSAPSIAPLPALLALAMPLCTPILVDEAVRPLVLLPPIVLIFVFLDTAIATRRAPSEIVTGTAMPDGVSEPQRTGGFGPQEVES